MYGGHLETDRALHGRLGGEAAASWIGSLPTLFIFIFFQRYFIKGLTLGAVKG